MVRSETYKSKSSAKNCIKSVQERGPKAETIDEA
ncbi:YegP family protein [Devosia neptuniae]|uniref:YegP family protein n=2 Tax=Devosia neptuniae TaxID=191302 RepID=A0ABY6CJ34_9HYPH|nr:YegP family protein [Devosia neptuniae]UXN72092.1 YegP family protein [Devosia neptuniae]